MISTRRTFISQLVAGCVAPMFLPGAGRLWVPKRMGCLLPGEIILWRYWEKFPKLELGMDSFHEKLELARKEALHIHNFWYGRDYFGPSKELDKLCST